jgi:hypothetical protein
VREKGRERREREGEKRKGGRKEKGRERREREGEKRKGGREEKGRERRDGARDPTATPVGLQTRSPPPEKPLGPRQVTPLRLPHARHGGK